MHPALILPGLPDIRRSTKNFRGRCESHIRDHRFPVRHRLLLEVCNPRAGRLGLLLPEQIFQTVYEFHLAILPVVVYRSAMASRKIPARKRKICKRKQVRGHHPPHVKIQARELYLYTASTLLEIADMVKVPVGTIRSWYFIDKWTDARRKLEKDLQERSDFEAAQIIHENRNKVMKRHLQVGEKLEEQIEKNIASRT